MYLLKRDIDIVVVKFYTNIQVRVCSCNTDCFHKNLLRIDIMQLQLDLFLWILHMLMQLDRPRI